MSLLNDIQTGTETLIADDRFKDRVNYPQKKLRVKLGVDPTRPDLTFGHMVVLNKLRQFQDMGHQGILIIGDYTAMIGDPAGRSVLRPSLSKEEVQKNAETYLDQAYKILDRNRTEVHRNSQWFESMSFEECLNLSRRMTVARMLERDDFSKRYRGNIPISIVEFLYPLIQGYDSVMIKSDVELGGSDQLFNMLVGRKLQEEQGLIPQAVITTPLLVGLDGEKKMSKSSNNYIAFNDPPQEMFGKIMSINDDLMWDYYRLLLSTKDDEIDQMKKENHPMENKKHLAKSLVSQLYNPEISQYQLDNWNAVFSKNQVPNAMPEYFWEDRFSSKTQCVLTDLLSASNLFASKGAAKRLVQQGAIKVNGVKIIDPNSIWEKPVEPMVIQSGKRLFFRVIP